MKIAIITTILLAISSTSMQGQTQTTAAGPSNVPAPTDYQVIRQDANSQIWQQTTYENAPNGNVQPHIHQYTELATGLNHLVNGQWVPSSEEISILPDGTAAATNGQHQAYFPTDIYNSAIKLVTPDGKILQSQPVALSYDDGSNTVLIAILTNSVGQIVGNNEVIYTNAFGGLSADLRYTYRKDGFEQDVVLHEQPPAPADLGLNPVTTKIQVMTEFFNSPQPKITAWQWRTSTGATNSNANFNFGSMTMIPSKAFSIGSRANRSLDRMNGKQVQKMWTKIQNRQFLIEELPITAIGDDLESLPLSKNYQNHSYQRMPSIAKGSFLPITHLVKAKSNQRGIQLAKMNPTASGLVLDYDTVNSSLTNYTFQADMTYYVSGVAYFGGKEIFEGGTVIKFARNAALSHFNVDGSLVWETTPYRPAVFTAVDDNSVGVSISGSTGSPTGYYADYAILYGFNDGLPSYFRIAYAQTAVEETLVGDTVDLSNGQIVNCQTGITIYGTSVNLDNILFDNVQTNFFVTDYSGGNALQLNLDNSTISGSSILLSSVSQAAGNQFQLTNSILANISSLMFDQYGTMTISGVDNGFYGNGFSDFGDSPIDSYTYPFQTIGGGAYYLTNGCVFRGAGTINIDPTLLADLANETTYPPIVYSNETITLPLILSPQAPRDNAGHPDLGYHYSPLDYVFGGCILSTNLNITAGTAVGWFESGANSGSDYEPFGISLNNWANLTMTGTATSPCWMVRSHTVQENANIWPDSGFMGGVMFNGGASGTAPKLNTQFTKWTMLNGDGPHFRDNWAYGEGTFANTEFYIGGMQTYRIASMYFTNSLFFRDGLYFFDQDAAPVMTINNCTFYNGILVGSRTSGQNQFWTIENTTFDGTGFRFTDYYDGNSSYTLFNYNAYNTNNLSGLTVPFPYGATTNFLEVIGPNDVMVTNYNWETSWFGGFYLPTNSPLINGGSTTANLLGLYHFTTQTNQTVEGDSVVDIGYHYVATDDYGNPLDTNDDGIPDYLEDINGNGLADAGEIPWNLPNDLLLPPDAWYTEYGLSVQSALQDPDLDGLLNYQEYLYGTNPNISQGWSIWIGTPNETISIP